MAYQVFISYRRFGGEALAFLLNERLTSIGYHVFYDRASLSHGRFDMALLQMMDECSDVVVILPPGGLDRCVNEGDWFRLEIAHALQSGKNIVPVMMDGFSWPDELPEDIQGLRRFQGVHVSFEFFDGFMDRLIKALMLDSALSGTDTSRPGHRHVLFWSDFENAILDKIISRLDLGDGYYAEELSEPLEILSKNLSDIDTIVLIVTDVTKFSNNDTAIRRINEALVGFVRDGGRLVCTHDVIYRRTRNDPLQQMYGCQITNFRQMPEVGYHKTDDCRDAGAFSELPDSFVLHDDEVCWGDLAPDVDIYFTTEDGIPLVFSREYGKGICLYLNPGDYKKTPPRSILKPEKDFINLLREAIRFPY